MTFIPVPIPESNGVTTRDHPRLEVVPATLFPAAPCDPQWQGSAVFESFHIGKLRWRLDRWRGDGLRALICMANPSTAGATDDDATIRRLKELLPGVDGFTVVNWEPYIATNPKDLYAWREEWSASDEYLRIRGENVDMIHDLSASAAIRFIAWGNLVPTTCPHTSRILLAMSHDLKYPLMAFETTKDGSPKHPAARGKHRIKAGCLPIVWRQSQIGGAK